MLIHMEGGKSDVIFFFFSNGNPVSRYNFVVDA